MNVFGRSWPQWQTVIDRFEFIVECLADNNSRCNSSECGGLRPQYLSLYFKIFYLYRRGGDIKPGFAKYIIEHVERDYEEVQAFEASADTLLAFPKAFAPILSGDIANPESAYSDPILLGFLQRFFAKQLPPKLQAIVEDVYAQVEHPIRLVDGRVEC